jgi:hypothetical protein
MREKFYSEILKEGYYSGDLGVEGRMLLKWILKQQNVGVDWIHLTQDRDQWRAVVNSVMQQKAYISRPASDYQLLKKDSASWGELVIRRTVI